MCIVNSEQTSWNLSNVLFYVLQAFFQSSKNLVKKSSKNCDTQQYYVIKQLSVIAMFFDFDIFAWKSQGESMHLEAKASALSSTA